VLHINKLFSSFILKILLVKIKLYCSQNAFAPDIFELLLVISENLVKMAKRVLTLQMYGNKQGLVLLEIPKLKLGLFFICTCYVDHLSFYMIKGQGEACLTYKVSFPGQSHLQKQR